MRSQTGAEREATVRSTREDDAGALLHIRAGEFKEEERFDRTYGRRAEDFPKMPGEISRLPDEDPSGHHAARVRKILCGKTIALQAHEARGPAVALRGD